MYLSSADLMTRNTQRRVEVACPIFDREIRGRLGHILALCLADNVKARQLQPDGSYVPLPRGEGPGVDCQRQLMEEAAAPQPERPSRRPRRSLGQWLQDLGRRLMDS